jgi:alpha-L-rhamnosidase
MNFLIANSAPVIGNLMVEYTKTPIGIDVILPRFSWQMIAPDGERGYSQTAYQIEVKDTRGNVVWDTKKVAGDVSLGVQYAGSPLTAITRYNWTVTVWDQSNGSAKGASWFETGLMNPDPGLSAWDGAQWIGGSADDMVLYSHYLSVFKVEYSLQLDQVSGSSKAGFVLGANDSRLLDKNMNIYGIASEHNGHYIKFELDLTAVDGSEKGLAKFNIYRVGYHPNDKPDKPLYIIDVPLTLIHAGNKYQPHQVTIESIFGGLTVYINGAGNDNVLRVPQVVGQRGGGININPIGAGGDYISFPMVADIGFSMEAGQKASFTDVAIRNYRNPSNILFKEDLTTTQYKGIFAGYTAREGSGLIAGAGVYALNGGNNGLFIVSDPSHNSMPMMRAEFSAKAVEIEKARLYITARGIYEVYINGKRVGEDYFNPGLTQYNITHLYQTYDVTAMIVAGSNNAIGAWLGEGWWSGNYTFSGNNWNYFGDRQSLLAKLVITYKDGSVKVVTTNNSEWKYFNDGPVVYGSFFQGEAYDARKETAIAGWNRAGYKDIAWKKVQIVPLEGTAFLGSSSGFMGAATTISYDSLSIIGQIGGNAGVIKTLQAQSVKEVRPGVFVYDMGQNMVGIPSIIIKDGKAEGKIRMRFAEVLYPDLKEYEANTGMVMLENIRAAHAQDLYILKAGENIIRPHFTFHGYRYIEITGIDKALPLEAVQGLVISSIKELNASYMTSNEKVNRLWQNIVWSQYGNFLSIPTDCPQRNERLGWSGDISVYSRTSTYVANVDQFFRRHMFAMRDMQSSNGRFSDVAPVGNGFGGILWGSAGITVAWETYQQYGDIGLLREHYGAMQKYLSFLDTRIDAKTGVMSEGPLGDWLSPEGNKNDNTLLFSAYHIFDLGIMAKVSEALGKTDDAAAYLKKYNERKEHFNKTYIDPQTHKTIKSSYRAAGFTAPGSEGPSRETPPEAVSSEIEFMDTQASYAIPLALGVFNDENKSYVAKNLTETVKRENTDDGGVKRPAFSLMTGFIGTAWISKALSDNGYGDIAYKLLQQESYPSWLYPVNQGATSIWERLNSYTIENGFGGNNSMNSFNHYSFGAVGQWMMAYSLGIQRDEPGFKNFILQPDPEPTGQMTWATGYYDSMFGRINSSWKVDNGILTYTATVPANTTATLYLPAGSAKAVKEGGKDVNNIKGITFIKFENGKAVYELKSGSYEFVSNL